MFPFVKFWGKFILSTDFRLPLWGFLTWSSQWSRACYAVWWGFSTELLRESTVHKLIYVHESSRFSSCSTEHLRIVSPQPRTPTRRRQSIDVYDLQSPTSSRIDEWSSRYMQFASDVNFLRRLFVSALTIDSDWSICYFWAQIKSCTCTPKFLTLTKSLIGICLSVFIYCYKNYL